ncbi:hypothetical protein TNCV_4140761 [Trichonephila clavipes]|nr:hypothetical protein TNCV_4140761 [Trichonephila clavipes]
MKIHRLRPESKLNFERTRLGSQTRGWVQIQVTLKILRIEGSLGQEMWFESNTRTIGGEPHRFESQSSDENDTSAEVPILKLPRQANMWYLYSLSSDTFNMPQSDYIAGFQDLNP